MSATITALPPAAQPTDDRSTFNTKEFAHRAALPQFVDEANALAAEVEGNALDAEQSAIAANESRELAEAYKDGALGSAQAAASSAGAAPWASGSYTTGQTARSGIDYRVYVARTTGAKPTDPKNDPTNWRLATAGGLPDVPYAGTSATVSLNERSRFTNSGAVAVTVPVPTSAGEEWACEFDNGRYDNTVDIGAAVLTRGSRSLSGVITMNKRTPMHLVSVGPNAWRIFV